MDARHRRRACLRRLLSAANSYEQWRDIAEQLYALEEADMPAGDVSTRRAARLYDRKLLLEKTNHLRSIRATGNVKEIMLALRTDLIRNIANIAKSQLHEHFVSIPDDIARYLAEMKEQLAQLVEWPEDELSAEEKLAFFRETRHTFGRTALLLSGGGGLGTFHIGVVKALFERQLLPRVLAGSSVGSIVCGIIATKTDAELRDLFSRLDEFDVGFFSNSRAVELVQHLINKGSLQDMSYMIKKLRGLMGDATFLEAYERTGRILNVTVCPADTNEPPRLLNYLTAPNALIWSAVAASSAFPGLYPAQHILARNSRGEIIRFSAQSTNDSLERRWRDGSLELDLPVQALGEMFNCNHFLVSQTNPHIVPLLNLKKALSRKWANVLEAELKHRCQVAQWLLPEWVPSKWLMLFTQAWEGDITMTLPSALWHLSKTIVNPTTEELIRSVKVGEVATWEKLSAIECNCSIEATLDKCLANIANQVRGYRLQRMHNRIPSWLHMSAVGLPAVASWGHSDFAEAAASIAAAASGTSGAARGASWGTPHTTLAGLGLADAAAAGGGIGNGGLPPLPLPPPAPSTGRRSGVATGGGGGPPSSTHPLAVAGSMTSSTLALLNMGGAGGVCVGSPPVGLGAIGSPAGAARGGMPSSYSLAALHHGGRGGAALGPDGLPRPRYSDGGVAFASPTGGAAAAAGAVNGVPVALGAVPAAAVHANGHHHNGVLGGPHHGPHHGHGPHGPHHGPHGGHGLGLGAIGGLMGGLMGGVDGLMRMGSSPHRFGPLSGFVGGGATGSVAGALRGVGGAAGGGGGGASVAPSLPTWVDAASECEDSASDIAAGTAGSVGAGSSSAAGAAGSSAAGAAGDGGGRGSGSNSRSDSANRISQELLDLAYCDCTDSSARDLWSTLLPLAQQSVSLGESALGAASRLGGGASATGMAAAAAAAAARRAGGTSDPDALDVFAY
ncbi:hypothetical protein HXX76_015956 [Chlamydomonas incerta]|uniref:PNPLA domain-containing protein n=1 Tax=Chlamydomonas incerta TaxID=51695 RepID=A0A835S856_CHLIN|nr:hypothetical protein HXX76_015956 [Chlamydomonas incerta]|eukprot:KAG2422528.1 hypothetical protein HXX76_015956 [Chlamydomonas incerta]